MNRKIFFIADAFLEDILGGGELNNEELFKMLDKQYKVYKVRSHAVTNAFLKDNKDSFFIVSNFINLKDSCIEILSDLDYIIYEHDHKYIKSRNPAVYEDFIAPKRDIVNLRFYKNAKKVFCQSLLHKNIMQKNINIENIHNLSGNLWSEDNLSVMRILSRKEKKDRYSIMNSLIKHKNTKETAYYCDRKGLQYDLVASSNYNEFLSLLSSNKKFMFLPKTPETLSRVVVEARMMGCVVTTNNLVGAVGEPWFKLKGEELIDYMFKKRKEIFDIVVSLYKERKIQKDSPKVSIITTFHEGDKYLSLFMENMINQTFFELCELIIIDAASAGNEQKLIKKYCENNDNIIYIRLKDKLLPSPCLNMAIENARGKYITFAFIDDYKKLNCIEKLYNFITKESVDLVYGDVIQIKNHSEVHQPKEQEILFEHSTYPFSKENMVKCLPGPMPMWNHRIHEKCGLFDDLDCNYADDWEMWLRSVSHGFRFRKINEVVGYYMCGGRSQQNDLNQRKEEAKIFFKYSHIFGDNYHKYYPYFKQFISQQRRNNDK